MSARVIKYYPPRAEIEDEHGNIIPMGAKDGALPKIITTGGESFMANPLVADDYTRVVLWQDGDSGVTAFDFLMIETDLAVLIEYTIDRAGTPAYGAFELPAGHVEVRSSDDMVAAVLTNGSETTMDQIDQIAVKNNTADGTGDATVTLRLFD